MAKKRGRPKKVVVDEKATKKPSVKKRKARIKKKEVELLEIEEVSLDSDEDEMEEEIIPSDDEEKIEYNESGQPIYANRYILSLQRPKDECCFAHIDEGNVLKDMKVAADKLFEKEKRDVVVWDREAWTSLDVYRLTVEKVEEIDS